MNLLPHNRTAYEAVEEALETSSRTCVIHPTGTGKSYIGLQIIEDNPDDRILYITSCAANLTEFRTKIRQLVGPRNIILLSSYAKQMVSEILTEDKSEGIEETEQDLAALQSEENGVDDGGPAVFLALYAGLKRRPSNLSICLFDEFHRMGAKVWEKNVRSLMTDNPDMKSIGFSATPIRHADNNRDMSKEMFDGNVASLLTLVEALERGLLPIPYYLTGMYSFEEDIKKASRKINRIIDRDKAKRLVNQAKRKLELAGGLDTFFKDEMIRHGAVKGKFIVFCSGIEHLENMMAEAEAWFSWTECNMYKMYRGNRDGYEQFLNDDTPCLRLLFAVDMLNEGVHIKGVDGIIMLRPTGSPNIYFQQLGRALSVEANRDHPIVFDVVKNAAVLAPARQFWTGLQGSIAGKPFEEFFEVYSRDLEILAYLREVDQMPVVDWYWYYDQCVEFYKEKGHIKLPWQYKVNGHNVNAWLNHQRQVKDKLTDDQINKLDSLGMEWVLPEQWKEKTAALHKYFDEHGDLNITKQEDEATGLELRLFMQDLRQSRKRGELSEERIRDLDSMNFVWDASNKIPWEVKLAHLKEYFEEHGNLKITRPCFSKDGFNLSLTVDKLRSRKDKLTDEQIEILDSMGMIWSRVFRNIYGYNKNNYDYNKKGYLLKVTNS